MIPLLRTSTLDAQVVKAASDLEAMRKAWHMFYFDVGSYPNYDRAMANTHLFTNIPVMQGWSGPYISHAAVTPWRDSNYYYYNQGGCYPDGGIWGGVTVYIDRNEASLTVAQFLEISSRLNDILDGDGDDTVGIFRRDGTFWLAYQIDDGCQ
ncbi:MAG: type II secretion system protein GspG [Candidatus Omnitrophota bacterium]